MSNPFSDLKRALRGLKNRRGFAVTVALTLGLGLGLNATVFGLLDALLLRPVLFSRSRLFTFSLSPSPKLLTNEND